MACIFAYNMTTILPIMLALCLMLSLTYYAKNCASIYNRLVPSNMNFTNKCVINIMFKAFDLVWLLTNSESSPTHTYYSVGGNECINVTLSEAVIF